MYSGPRRRDPFAAYIRARSDAERVATIARLLTAGGENALGPWLESRMRRHQWRIAATLGISRKRVETHVGHVYEKAGVSTRAGATMFAVEHGLVGGD